jgi:hypothetical protein
MGAAVAVAFLASGVALGHAVTNTAETAVDCLIVNGVSTGQTKCAGGVAFTATTDQIFNVAAGALITDCTFVSSSLSPTFLTSQGLGPFHVQTPQFNDISRSDPNAVSDSNKSFGSGGTVTYTATTVTDTAKSWNFTTFNGMKIQSKFNTATIASSTGNTITLSAAWSPSTPAAGDPYQVAPCTDNLGGTTQTVTINGWVQTALDEVTDETNAEGLGTSTCPNPPVTSACDVVNIGVPLDGAVVYESPGQCQLTVNSSTNHTTKFQVDAGTDDNTMLSVSGTATGTDNASNIPVQVAAGGGLSCPGGGGLVNVNSFYTGSLVYSTPVVDH